MSISITRGLSWYLANYTIGDHDLKVKLYKTKAALPSGGAYDHVLSDFTELDGCTGYTAGGITLTAASWTKPAPPGSNTGGNENRVGYGSTYIGNAQQTWTFGEPGGSANNIPLGYYITVTVSSVEYLLWYESYPFPQAPQVNDDYKVTPKVEL